jgi:hypothetical protein
LNFGRMEWRNACLRENRRYGRARAMPANSVPRYLAM